MNDPAGSTLTGEIRSFHAGVHKSASSSEMAKAEAIPIWDHFGFIILFGIPIRSIEAR
jgi:hypothetical protein